ncbi:MAG: transketolase C-terminal domain-containing protein [Candidatus Aminicenantia bacterium]
MSKITVLTGNASVAEAIRQIEPDVVAAYPITPSTAVVQYVAQFVADGLINSEFICPESEHSAMSMCIGASSAGARVVTATASQGLALMWELLYIAAGLRLPIVTAVACRALSAPINIHGDHSDTFGARDSGWIQLYSENPQEAYDNMIQAIKIAENPEVRTPVLVGFDGFVTSHSAENVIVEDDDEVKKFIGVYNPPFSILDYKKPMTLGSIVFTDYYFEMKRNQIEGIEKAREIIKKVGMEFGEKFGRKYDFFEEYRTDDAELIIIVMGSAAGTAKATVDELREEGKKVGVIKLRVLRPFPYIELQSTLKKAKAIGVMDRSMSPGGFGAPLFIEVMAALYPFKKRPMILNFIYGLGGRDVTMENVEEAFSKLEASLKKGWKGELINYLNLRE